MATGPQRNEAALARLVAAGTGALSVATTSHAIWLKVSAALVPIVGQQGMAALYRRSLHLSRAQFPGVPGLDTHAVTADFTALSGALSSQTDAEALAMSLAIYGNFCDLLSSLIGPSLTDRLLGSVLDGPSTDSAEQEPSP